ncbi:MAG: hypothetical protein ACREJ9_09405 [Candidatus Rokuibacteriota bacterium]
MSRLAAVVLVILGLGGIAGAEAQTQDETIVYVLGSDGDRAAYLFKWGLRGVGGVSNRIDYEAPRDEIDRMYTVTPRKK